MVQGQWGSVLEDEEEVQLTMERFSSSSDSEESLGECEGLARKLGGNLRTCIEDSILGFAAVMGRGGPCSGLLRGIYGLSQKIRCAVYGE